jgi:hypothetical protein
MDIRLRVYCLGSAHAHVGPAHVVSCEEKSIVCSCSSVHSFWEKWTLRRIFNHVTFNHVVISIFIVGSQPLTEGHGCVPTLSPSPCASFLVCSQLLQQPAWAGIGAPCNSGYGQLPQASLMFDVHFGEVSVAMGSGEWQVASVKWRGAAHSRPALVEGRG